MEIVKLIVCDQKYFMFDSSRDIKEAVNGFSNNNKDISFFNKCICKFFTRVFNTREFQEANHDHPRGWPIDDGILNMNLIGNENSF